MPKPYKRIEDDTIKRAALYIRVSTEEQAMHGLSLTAQRETLTKYVEDNSLRLVGIYADEGITARKKYRNRTEFMRMLKDVQADKIDLILFIKLDRWFRNIADYYEVQKILDDHKVRWIATEEDYDTTTANGRLHLNIKLSIAQDESDRTSERIKFVFDSKKRRGEVVGGAPPLGYRIENKHLVVDPEICEMAVDIFNYYIAARSLKALRRHVLDAYGRFYTDRGLKMMLSNQRYIGSAYGQDDYCPAIINPETFSLVQSILAERAQRNGASTSRIYLFTGLTYCAECGSRLSAHTINDKYIYYRCTRYEKWRSCDHKKRTSELVLEDWLIHNVAYQFERYNMELEAMAAQPRPKIDEAKIRRKMEKLKDLYLNDLIDRNTYEQDYTTLRDELREATAAEEQLPKPVDVKSVADALSTYSELSKQGKKEFWSRTVGKIIITNDDEFFIVPI